MEELCCPRCRTTKKRNPSLKLLVNVCGHSLCDNCVEVLFVRGSGACPECGVALRRNNFRIQVFEDADVEKDVDVRKSILRIYNKKETDFATLDDYNNYLEEVEDIIFNLSNNIDVEETKQRVEQYKRDNQEQIKKNKSKLSEDEKLIEELILHEHEMHELGRKKALEEEEQTRHERLRKEDELIDQLMSDKPMTRGLIKSHVKPEAVDSKPSVFNNGSAGIFSSHSRDTIVPMKTADFKAELYTYKPLHIDNCGPPLPPLANILKHNYLRHIRKATEAETAGGFLSLTACKRALEDAFCGLYFSPVDASS